MNDILVQDIKRELTSGEGALRIQEAVMKEQEGIIEVFVRHGRHQITTPPPLCLLGGPCKPGLTLESYSSLVELVAGAVEKFEQVIEHGYLIISYQADDNGRLKHLNMQYKTVITHKK